MAENFEFLVMCEEKGRGAQHLKKSLAWGKTKMEMIKNNTKTKVIGSTRCRFGLWSDGRKAKYFPKLNGKCVWWDRWHACRSSI